MKTTLIGLMVLTSLAIFGCKDRSTNYYADLPNNTTDNGPGVQSQPGTPPANPDVTIKGFFDATDDGCYILTESGGAQVDLEFSPKFEVPKFRTGTYVEVVGRIAAQFGSRCVAGPVMDVDSIKQITGGQGSVKVNPVEL